MSGRTYFFPVPLDHFPLESLKAEQKTLRAVYKSWNDFHRMFCPFCQVFVKEDEIHFTDGTTCTKIVNGMK